MLGCGGCKCQSLNFFVSNGELLKIFEEEIIRMEVVFQKNYFSGSVVEGLYWGELDGRDIWKKYFIGIINEVDWIRWW